MHEEEETQFFPGQEDVQLQYSFQMFEGGLNKGLAALVCPLVEPHCWETSFPEV